MMGRRNSETADRAIVVTAFECPSLPSLLWLRIRGVAVERQVVHLDGLVESFIKVSLRRRRMVNISVWRSTQAIYAMGQVSSHVALARRVLMGGRIKTSSLIYDCAGDWRDVLFGVGAEEPGGESGVI